MVPFLLACGLETSAILQSERKEAATSESFSANFLHFGSLALRRFDVLTELQTRAPLGRLFHVENLFGADLAELIRHSGKTRSATMMTRSGNVPVVRCGAPCPCLLRTTGTGTVPTNLNNRDY